MSSDRDRQLAAAHQYDEASSVLINIGVQEILLKHNFISWDCCCIYLSISYSISAKRILLIYSNVSTIDTQRLELLSADVQDMRKSTITKTPLRIILYIISSLQYM